MRDPNRDRRSPRFGSRHVPILPLQAAAVLILLAPITPANADHSWNVAYMNISLICTLMC